MFLSKTPYTRAIPNKKANSRQGDSLFGCLKISGKAYKVELCADGSIDIIIGPTRGDCEKQLDELIHGLQGLRDKVNL